MNELPGQRTIDAGTTPREILLSGEGVRTIPGPNVIDATYAIDGSNTGRTDELRAGCLMAQIDTTKQWVPCKRTTVATGTTGTVTALTVVNAAFFKVGDIISVGADNSITVTAIDYTTNTLTIASTAVVDGEAVIATTPAGSKTCRGILKESVRMLTGVPYDSTNRDVNACIIVSGYIDDNQVIGDLAAIRADTGAYIDGFQWGDRQQNN